MPETRAALGEPCDPASGNCVTENAGCIEAEGSATCQCMDGYIQEGEYCSESNLIGHVSCPKLFELP